MSLTSTVKLGQIFRHLTIVVVLCAFLFAGNCFFNDPVFSSAVAYSPTFKADKRIKPGQQHSENATLSAGKQKKMLEATLPHFQVAFPQSLVAFQPAGLVIVFIPFRQAFTQFIPRASGCSLTARFFLSSIQPNAP